MTTDTALAPVEAPTIPANPVDVLIAQAIDKSVDIGTMEKLLAMRSSMMAEQARTAFFAALSAFQGACPIIPKTKTATITTKMGGSYKYSFAPLDVIVKHVSPILARHGLSFSADTRHEDRAIVAIVTVHHVAGYSKPSEFRAPIDLEAKMNAMQQVASAQTYAKRYAFCNALGILTGDDDDDGHGATGETQKRGPQPLRPPQQKSAQAEVVSDEPPIEEVREAFGLIPPDEDLPVSKPEIIEFFSAARANGYKDPEIKRWLKAAFGITSTKDLLRSQYSRALRWARMRNDQ
jgi:hypothetical protein